MMAGVFDDVLDEFELEGEGCGSFVGVVVGLFG